jgi:PAS domain S-box-containing protein
MTNGKHLNNEIRGIRSRSGETKWISINTRTLHQGAGAPPMAIVVSFTDITSKKSAEIELKRSEDKFRATIDQSSDGIIIIDADARIIEWNLAQTKIFGYTRDEMLGRPIEGYEHKGPRDGERSLAFLEMMQANMNALDARSDHAGIDGMFEFSVQCKDGCPKTVQVSMFPVMTSGVKIYCRPEGYGKIASTQQGGDRPAEQPAQNAVQDPPGRHLHGRISHGEAPPGQRHGMSAPGKRDTSGRDGKKSGGGL